MQKLAQQLSLDATHAEQQAPKPVQKWSLPRFLKAKQAKPEPPLPEVKWGLLDWGAYNQPWQVYVLCCGA